MKKYLLLWTIVFFVISVSSVHAKTEISPYWGNVGGPWGADMSYEENVAEEAAYYEWRTENLENLTDKIEENGENAGGSPVSAAPSIKIINVHIQMPFTELNDEMDSTVEKMNKYFWFD